MGRTRWTLAGQNYSLLVESTFAARAKYIQEEGLWCFEELVLAITDASFQPERRDAISDGMAQDSKELKGRLIGSQLRLDKASEGQRIVQLMAQKAALLRLKQKLEMDALDYINGGMCCKWRGRILRYSLRRSSPAHCDQ